MDISGASVLVTGATGGIGQAIARDLHGRGARLILTGRRSEVLEPLAGELGAQALAVDLGRREELDRLLEHLGAVDILVANAGLPGTGAIEDLPIAEIDQILDVNLRAPIVMARALAPGMIARGGGHLLFVSSLSGKAASALSSTYNATKFGLRGFALALRTDLRASNVGVSVVCPGFIREAGMFAQANVKLPKGVGTRSPEDVARAVSEAIIKNRAEVDVAPIGLRLGVTFASVAPQVAATVTRKTGGDQIAHALHAGHRAKG